MRITNARVAYDPFGRPTQWPYRQRPSKLPKLPKIDTSPIPNNPEEILDMLKRLPKMGMETRGASPRNSLIGSRMKQLVTKLRSLGYRPIHGTSSGWRMDPMSDEDKNRWESSDEGKKFREEETKQKEQAARDALNPRLQAINKRNAFDKELNDLKVRKKQVYNEYDRARTEKDEKKQEDAARLLKQIETDLQAKQKERREFLGLPEPERRPVIPRGGNYGAGRPQPMATPTQATPDPAGNSAVGVPAATSQNNKNNSSTSGETATNPQGQDQQPNANVTQRARRPAPTQTGSANRPNSPMDAVIDRQKSKDGLLVVKRPGEPASRSYGYKKNPLSVYPRRVYRRETSQQNNTSATTQPSVDRAVDTEKEPRNASPKPTFDFRNFMFPEEVARRKMASQKADGQFIAPLTNARAEAIQKVLNNRGEYYIENYDQVRPTSNLRTKTIDVAVPTPQLKSSSPKPSTGKSFRKIDGRTVMLRSNKSGVRGGKPARPMSGNQSNSMQGDGPINKLLSSNVGGKKGGKIAKLAKAASLMGGPN